MAATISQISELEKYVNRFSPSIPQTPTGRYASVILLRETKSYAVFTTEGGQQQDIERTQAGLTHSDPMDRLVMFKRKQVAPERRTGKALARQYGVFPFAIVMRSGRVEEVVYGEEAINEAQALAKDKKEVTVTPYQDCYLIEKLCTYCTDCLTYGYAAIEEQGSRKARVVTDSCFSVRPYPLIQKGAKFNVIDERAQTSGTITEYDYTLPEVFLPSVVTSVDLTLNEFVYLLGNLLRTTRYGKESSRQGFMRNHILAIAFSDVEIFSNLEFSQAFYDAFVGDEKIKLAEGFLSEKDFTTHAPKVIERLTANLNGRLQIVTGEDCLKSFDGKIPKGWASGLDGVLTQVRELNQDEAKLTAFLRGLNTQAASFAAA
jgi:CRISPR-associated protein Csc2